MQKQDTAIPPLSEAFCLVAELGVHMGIRNIKEMPEPWFLQLDEAWCLAINGTSKNQDAHPKNTMGATIPPCSMAVWYNGWLAALLSPCSGVFLNGSEDDFIKAVKARMEKEGMEPEYQEA